METIDLYAVLNVPADATPEQIRAQYLALSSHLHPDRLGQRAPAADGSPPLEDYAYIYVQRAHEVLADPLSRSAYDRFGLRGVEALHRMRHTAALKRPERVEREIEEYLRNYPEDEAADSDEEDSHAERQKRFLHMRRVRALRRGRIVLYAQALVDGKSPLRPLLTGQVLSHAVELHLSREDLVVLEGTVIRSLNSLDVGLTGTLLHILSHRNRVEVTAGVGPQAELGARFVRQASARDSYQVGAKLAPYLFVREPTDEADTGPPTHPMGPFGLPLVLEVAATRVLSRRAEATTRLELRGVRLVPAFSVRYLPSRKSVLRGEVELSGTSAAFTGAVERRVHKDLYLSVKPTLQLPRQSLAHAVSCEFGTQLMLSSAHACSLGLELSLRGVTLKLGYRRHEVNVMVPVYLGELMTRTVLVGSLGPLALFSFCRWAVSSVAGYVRNRQIMNAASPEGRRLLRERRAALDMQDRLSLEAAQIRFREELRGGLVILWARYEFQVPPEERDDEFPLSIDATIPLRALVTEDSKLELPEGVSKSTIPGLYLPSAMPDHEHILTVRYKFQDQHFICRVMDQDALDLPGQGHEVRPDEAESDDEDLGQDPDQDDENFDE
jgi:hypothetical protein